MNILALDLATKTGWATNAGGVKISGVQTFDIKRGESPGMRFLRCKAWLDEFRLLTGRETNVITYEQAHHRGGAATAVCVGFITIVQAYAAQHSIELMPVHTGTLKKFATGKGTANKEEMIKSAHKFGWSPMDDNEADAQLLLEYALSELRIK